MNVTHHIIESTKSFEAELLARARELVAESECADLVRRTIASAVDQLDFFELTGVEQRLYDLMAKIVAEDRHIA